MAKFNCFATLLGGKKKRSKQCDKGWDLKRGETNVSLRVKPIDLPSPSIQKFTVKEKSFDASLPKSKSEEHLARAGSPAEAAYEGGDEHDEALSMKRDFSDMDLPNLINSQETIDSNKELNPLSHELLEVKFERDESITPELMIQSGHVSDPGIAREDFLGSSPLKRSCSNIETKRNINVLSINTPTKSHSYTDLKSFSAAGNPLYRNQGSPVSVKSNCSADRVMLKKRSSSQVLPSRSRKIWWKLFLWSHRNLHNPLATSKPQKLGYSSDTLEITLVPDKKKKAVEESGNQWVAFPMDSASPFDRINAWVNSIEESQFCPIDDEDEDEDGDGEEMKAGIFFQNSPKIGESSGKNHSSHVSRRTVEEVMQANSVIQSLNSFSSVAHISGMGMKVVPSISAFTSLRTVNLSGNFLVQINPGSLPRSLHTLDLSRNKIATIEGLRELTRLRVLNLSYNRISRIGHGLSNCTLIKELYLAGNKISDVEGLHRLLKLTVLDLSFNKITTAKALGQLVANYNSLLAINLIGNPVQTNIGDDQLRKAVTGLLPHLTYLNKQLIKPQRAREAVTDSVAKAALGSSGGGPRRRIARRASLSSGTSVGGHQKGSRHKSKGRHQHSTPSRK